MKFTDAAELAGTRRTADGYLVADVLCARMGCQDYLGSDLGLMDANVVPVYRPESVVFHKDSMATFAGKPVTIGHPDEPVTADTWKTHAVGDIGEEIARDGEFIRVSIKVMDGAAIKAIEGGTQQISMGYTTGIELRDGTAPDGTKYGAVQVGPIRINHLAIVDRGRAGAECRISDADHWGAAPIPPSNKKEDTMSDALTTVVLGDKAAQVAAVDAPLIEAFKADSAKALADMATAHKVDIAAKDAEIAKVEAARDEAMGKILSDTELDKRVADRADLIGKAKAIVTDVKTDGQSDAAIRKAVVIAKLGDGMADKSDAYLDARFDILAEDKVDPVADVLKGGIKSTDSSGAWGKKVFDAAGVKMKEA